jgi:spermidine synthase
MDSAEEIAGSERPHVGLLLVSVLVIATCGLIYELIAGTLASYLLGDSVTQFSTIIGVYLFAMGIGSWLSKYISKNILAWFVRVEIIVGVTGGFSSSILFILFEQVESFRILLYTLILLIGIFVGIEIPLLMRILKDKFPFKDLVARVFTFDYIGALVASIIFPLVLIPHLGLIRTSLLFGLLNILIALIICFRLEKEIAMVKAIRTTAVLFMILMMVAFVYSETIVGFAESSTYPDKIIYAKSSSYQRILVTKNKNDVRLYLNGNLQFSSGDEYRYHEALVHVPAHFAEKIDDVLVMGGGDGMAVRELLKYPEVHSVTLVDLDKAMTDLFRKNTLLSTLNNNSFSSSKVNVVNEDAFQWLKENKKKFNLAIIDFPDPSNYSIGKLYTSTFYRMVADHLEEKGIVVIQSTSPYVAPKSFWCVNNTLESAGFFTMPYHVYVPAFGDWGYVMAAAETGFHPYRNFPDSLRFMNEDVLNESLSFPPDMRRRETQINKLNNQVLVTYFEEEWDKVSQQ